MGEAFDRTGAFLGSAEAATKREVLEKLMKEHGDNAHEIRIRSLHPSAGAPDSPSVEMPRYKCHKDVWALKIKDISDPTVPGNESDGSRLLHFEEPGYGARRVSREFVQKHMPRAIDLIQKHTYVGGYFVVYKDGYESFSPAQAFEEGYTRL
jgi:hypothetical protein